MKFFKWLISQAPDTTTPVKPIPAVNARPNISPPNPLDADEDIALDILEDEGEIELEPTYSIIDYKNAKGIESRRRITARKLTQGRDSPILKAVCHERKALRSFRCDRISCFISDDGEVIDPVAYFQEEHFIRIDVQKMQVADGKTGLLALREKLRPALAILVATSKCDRDFHPEEIDVICHYVEDELCDPAVYTGTLTPEDLDSFTDLIKKMRPQKKTLVRALSEVKTFEPHRLNRLADAIRKVMLADGRIASEEVELLEEFDELRNNVAGLDWLDIDLPHEEWD